MPNGNAYLAVALDDASRAHLAALQAGITASVARSEANAAFDPMAFDMLHLTFFFAGEALGRLPAHLLYDWHAAVAGAIAASGLRAEDGRLSFSGLDVFPPGKRNLVIARFDATERLRALRAEVIVLARGLGGELGDLAARDLDWSPHCTLGKVYASKAVVADVAARAIGKVLVSRECAPACAELRGEGVCAGGLELLGSIPRQQPTGGCRIDWRDSLRFR
jgi:2'-5' RNA ligase